jgi:glutamate racemase
MKNDLPIGVFDSGIGGLTVVKEIMKRLPHERIIYFGDTARVPYGNKSRDTVITYCRQIMRFLLGDGEPKVKAVVVACNTASALALDTIAKDSPVPVTGVVGPGAKAAIEATKNGRIGVIATESTIKSGIYNKVISESGRGFEVYGKACPLFVHLVEEGWADTKIAAEVAEVYLDELKNKGIDSLVLGCTHYPLLKKTIGNVMGDGVTLVNPALETAKSLEETLLKLGLCCSGNGIPEHRFYVSDGEEKFRDFANSILDSVHLETADVTRVVMGAEV